MKATDRDLPPSLRRSLVCAILTLLALSVGLSLCVVPAAADAWDVASGFSSSTPYGPVWQYGFVDSPSMPSGYAFTAPGTRANNFHDGTAGCRWFLDGTTTDGTDRCPYVGAFWGASAYWIFRKPPTPPGKDVYFRPTNPDITRKMPMVRWVAPAGGFYTFNGALTPLQTESHGQILYWVIQRNVNPSSWTTWASGGTTTTTPIALSATTNYMSAGDSLDFGVNCTDTYVRPWVRFEMVITSVSGPGPEAPGVKGYVQDLSGGRILGATVSDGTNSATTTSDGTYELAINTPGTYTISAGKTGYNAQITPGVGVGSVGKTVANFTLDSGTVAENPSLLLPDMPNIPKPSPEPALPAEFDVFTPPVSSVIPAASAPAFAEWTRTGGPDDTIVATGEKFSAYGLVNQGKDTLLTEFGQSTTSNAMLVPASTQRLDGMKAAFTNAQFPAWSTYLVWPRNANGYGYPIAINRTEGWWLGPKQAERGSTVAVYGRNLAHDNGTAISWVYIKKNSTTVAQVPVTAVNPYRVAFAVPGDLANGDYEVWIHNGHGGHYGWSGPLTLSVYGGPGWTGVTFNVKTYGAHGDGVTDDEAAINAAVSAAAGSPYSTVYFPAGSYMVSRGIYPMPSNVRIKGDGKDISIIKANSGFVQTTPEDIRRYGFFTSPSYSVVSNIEFDDLTFDTNQTMVGAVSPLYLRNCRDVRFASVKVKSIGYESLYLEPTARLFINDCDLIGKGVWLGASSQVLIDHCNFYSTDDANYCVNQWGACEVSVTNCTAQDFDTAQALGWGTGRFYTGGGNRTSSYKTYIADNATYNMGPRPGADQNVGEQIMWENGQTKYRGTPTSATGATVTLPGLSTDYTGYDAVIVRGKGLGQHRAILGYSNGTITVSPAWSVVPDATSTVLIECIMDKVTVYRNTLQSKDTYASRTEHNATCGVEPYGGGYDWTVDGNTFDRTRTGTSIWSISPQPGADFQPCYFHLYANNNYRSNRWGGMSSIADYDIALSDPGVALLGHVYRRNTITSPVLKSFGTVSSSWLGTGKAADMLVFEHNTSTNTPVGIDAAGIGSSLQSVIAYKNNFSRGSASSSGSIGFGFANGQTIDLRENVWTDFQSIYSGPILGQVLEVPQRFFNLIGNVGGQPVTAQVNIWNAGIAGLDWSVSDDAPWLSVSGSSGSIAGEALSSTLTLTCDPSGLASGTYTGTITVIAGSQTKKLDVVFTVCSPNISDAKRSADGSAVGIRSGLVSAVFGNVFYVQAADRSCGIRVEKPGHGLSVGMAARVTGTITTNSDGERRIIASTAVQDGTDVVSVLPLFTINRAIGGGDYYYSSSDGAGQEGVAGSSGLNNVGLLVRTTGAVTYTDPAGAFVYINDGSGASDGNTLGAGGSAVSGVRVILPSAVTWPAGDHFAVTGVSSLTTVGGPCARAILVRTSADISVLL